MEDLSVARTDVSIPIAAQFSPTVAADHVQGHELVDHITRRESPIPLVGATPNPACDKTPANEPALARARDHQPIMLRSFRKRLRSRPANAWRHPASEVDARRRSRGLAQMLSMAKTARTLGGIRAGAVAMAAAGVLLAGCAVAPSRDVALPVHAVRVHARVVALSFDDGPDPRWTPRVLALLRRYRARATFFVTGENALAHPGLLRDEVAAGDEVGDHTYSHPYLTRLNADVVRQQIKEAALAIQQAGAPRPTLFRPPYGLIDRTIERAAQADNLRLILWSVCVERFVNHGPSRAEVARILSRVRPGAIILAHDGGIPDRRRTLAALPLLLGALQRRGYQIVTVGRLLAQQPDAGSVAVDAAQLKRV